MDVQEAHYLHPFGGVGVSIFLILSGYGTYISYQKKGFNKFWKKKLVGILIPYIVIEIIAFIFGLVYYKNFFEFIFDSFLIFYKHPLGWYLQCIFIYYICFYICFKKNRNYKCFFLVSLIVALAFFALKKDIFIEQVLSFPFGVFLAHKGNEKSLLKNKNGIIMFIMGMICLGLKQTNFIRSNYILLSLCQILIKFPIALAIIVFVNMYSKWVPTKVCITFGKRSYYLYLCHMYILIELQNYIKFGYGFITVFFIIIFLFVYFYEVCNLKLVDKHS